VSRLDTIGFGSFDQAIKRGSRLCPLRSSSKEPVVPADDKGMNAVFSQVVVYSESAMLDIAFNLIIGGLSGGNEFYLICCFETHFSCATAYRITNDFLEKTKKTAHLYGERSGVSDTYGRLLSLYFMQM
jgi:hypothetical protein